jgi:mono/diheme cytochrome c family protein
MLQMRLVRRAGIVLAGATLALAVAVPAFAATAPPPGNAKKGKAVFVANCVTCHTFKAGGGRGTIGPNLDQKKPGYKLVIARVTNGKGAMQPYKSILTKTQIQDVAAFIYATTKKR